MSHPGVVHYGGPGVVSFPHSESGLIPYGGPSEFSGGEYSSGETLPTPGLGPLNTEES